MTAEMTDLLHAVKQNVELADGDFWAMFDLHRLTTRACCSVVAANLLSSAIPTQDVCSCHICDHLPSSSAAERSRTCVDLGGVVDDGVNA